MNPVSFPITDKFSMFGWRLLPVLEQRCRESKPVSNKYFERLFVYIVGEFRYLQPIKDIPLYKRHIKDILALRRQTLVRTFEKSFTLRKSTRQSDDQQTHFREILDSLSVTQAIYIYPLCYMLWHKSILPSSDLEKCQDAKWYFPTNKHGKIIIEKYCVNQNRSSKNVSRLQQSNSRMEWGLSWVWNFF